MKIARTIGLAVLAAMALMASVGAGSALATETTLCESGSASPYCESKDRYGSGTALETSSAILTISTSILTVKCESTLKGTTGAEAGEPLPVTISSWAFAKCGSTAAMSNCKGTVVKNLPFAGSLTRTSGSNGTLTLASGGSGQPRLFVQCGEALHCEWTLDPTITVEGGSPAQIGVGGSLKAVGGYICPKTTSVQASYALSSPAAAYVAKPEELGTQLCKVEQSPCEVGNSYPSGTSIEAESKDFVIKIHSASYTCEKATVAMETKALMGDPMPIELTSFGLQGCTISGAQCKVETSIPSPNGTLEWIGGTNGQLGQDAYESTLFACGPDGIYTCRLGRGLAGATIYGTAKDPARLVVSGASLVNESPGSGCATLALMSASFTVTSPQPLYVVY